MGLKPNLEDLKRKITDLKRRNTSTRLAEEKARIDGERFRIFFKAANDAIFVHPLKEEGFSPFVEVNDIALTRYGYTREEFLKLTAADITIKPDANGHSKKDHRKKLLDTGHQVFQSVHIKKNGETFPVEINSNIVYQEGKPYILAIVRDITERVQAQQAVMESESKYRVLVENSRDLIFKTDRNGKLTFTNKNVKDVLGYSDEDISHMTGFDIIHPDDIQSVREQFDNFLKGEGAAAQYRCRKKDGSFISLHNYTTPLFDKKGSAVEALCIARDITDKMRLEEQAMQVQKMEAIGTLAGGIAHDFNNILSVITGNISYALSQMDNNNPLHDILTDVFRGAKQARSLTKQLLTFAKGGVPVKCISNVNRLVEETATFVTRGTKVKCRFRLAKNLWPSRVDEGQIQQVIGNMIINANQSMPHGGVITVQTENLRFPPKNNLGLKGGEYVKITIGDQGIGIPEGVVSKIFEPYFTTKQKGSGLGLATAYSIVKRHNGHIAVRSEIDHGTEFYVYLPASSKNIVPEKEGGTSEKGRNGKILIMDDQESILRMARRMLESMGHQVECATEGKAAVSIYERALSSGTPFDIVILDITVPGGMGGVETVQALLKINPDVKAIVSSGYSSDPVMAAPSDYGFSEVMPKPYTKKQVSELLNKLLHEEG